jgi:hypothetical protein
VRPSGIGQFQSLTMMPAKSFERLILFRERPFHLRVTIPVYGYREIPKNNEARREFLSSYDRSAFQAISPFLVGYLYGDP